MMHIKRKTGKFEFECHGTEEQLDKALAKWLGEVAAADICTELCTIVRVMALHLGVEPEGLPIIDLARLLVVRLAAANKPETANAKPQKQSRATLEAKA